MAANRWSIALLQQPIYLGYIARQLQSGQSSSLSQYTTPFDYTTEERAILREALRFIIDQYGAALVHRICERPTFRSPGYTEMKRVLDMLHQHSEPLSASIDTRDVENILPPFIHQTNDLLSSPPFTPFGREDALALAMARWFKNGFMTWVDPIKCPLCKGSTQSIGSDEPTAKERGDGGGRVELHACVDGACGGVRRFVRYGRPRKLLKTREGRCGEWAHLFYVFMRYMGLSARYVWNSEDHVWAEYWSPTLGHWVHVDPCEASTNQPLLYALGWGKKQAFCIALGPEGAEDVTRAYVDDWHGACQGRRRTKGWSEKELKMAILESTVAIRLSPRPALPLATMEARDKLQATWINDDAGRMEEARREQLGGRTSGTVDWRAKRQELGLHITTIPHLEYSVVQSLSDASRAVDIFGDAVQLEDSILLTSGQSQTSAIFLTKPISQVTSLRVHVSFRLTAPPGADGADGIAVVFTPERKLGLGGYGMGYTGSGGQGDFAVEVDTFRTQDYADDPPVPHISLHSPPDAHHRHSLACTQTDSIPYLSDGSEYTLELIYNGSTREVTAFLLHQEEEEEISLSLWQIKVPHPEGEARDWFVGVTGSCGGLWQKQEILEWTVEEINFGDVAGVKAEAAGGKGLLNTEGINKQGD